jgi:pimeloyl-ACP methyl ester carboxylesterase
MRRLGATLLSATAALCWSATAAQADFGPCAAGASSATTCETLTVPLDRSGSVPGDVHLLVERRASAQPSTGALVVLAGGPGQASTPLIDPLARSLAPALLHRDLVVFDVRGTGGSDPLACAGLNAPTFSALDSAVEACANGLGARRAFYTSRDNADDIDAVRQSLGLDRISLYGVSYGTLTALTYARRHPQHVESLVLDSVIGPGGRDPLDRTTYEAFPRVLKDICTAGCQGITRDPVADLFRVVGRAQRQPLRATAFTSTGKPLRGTLSEADIATVLEAADFDPVARADIPGALASAVRGDNAPLARLLIREGASGGGSFRTAAGAGALAPAAPRATAAATTVTDSQALFFATECEETPFPWSRTAPLSDRPAQLDAALAAVPASVYAPFSRRPEAATGTSRPCLRWPDASPDSPIVTGPPPDVPVLLLEGRQDTRTPVADAQAVAALFPHATLVTVPWTGHSVVGTDLTDCSQSALASFFSTGTAGQCPATPAPVPLSRIAPTSVARLRTPRGVGGRPGKTVAAVASALSDNLRQSIAAAALGLPIAGGGLRGGSFHGTLFGSVLKVRLSGLVFVPGVKVSGTLTDDLASSSAPSASVRVSGPAASAGTLTFRSGRFTGRLGGRGVHSHAAAAAAGLAKRPLQAWRLLRLRQSARFR